MQQYIANNLVQLITNHVERAAPSKFKWKTGQIVKILAENQKGLSRQELLGYFGDNLDSASFTRRESLRMSVEKLIQRSRRTFWNYNLTIIYNKEAKKYCLDVLHKH